MIRFQSVAVFIVSLWCVSGQTCCEVNFEGLGLGETVSELRLDIGYECADDMGVIGVFGYRAQDSAASTSNAAMIFDAASPTGGDNDLSNDELGMILIISEDFDASDPDDNARGGGLRFDFEQLSVIGSAVDVRQMILLDAEEPSPSLVLTYSDGSTATTDLPTSPGDGESVTVDLTGPDFPSMQNVREMRLVFPRSAALASFTICGNLTIAEGGEEEEEAGSPGLSLLGDQEVAIHEDEEESDAAVSNTKNYDLCCAVDFEGLEAGTLVNRLYQGAGFSCPNNEDIGRFIRLWGFRRQDLNAVNAVKRISALMIYDSANPESTGGDTDLYFPEYNKTLIISEDIDTTDPDDNAQGGIMLLDFQKLYYFGGTVDITQLTLLDVEEPAAKLKVFYSSGTSEVITLPTTDTEASAVTLDFSDMAEVWKIRFDFPGSGALAGFTICSNLTST